MTRPFQPLSLILACHFRSSSGPSVVAITSMLKRSKRARGRKASWARQSGDPVVMRIGVGGGERFIDAEQGLQHIVEPQTRRRATEQVIVLGKAPPDGASLGFNRCPVKARHAEVLKADALAEQHAVDVMIGNDEQPGRIGKGLIERIPAWIRMAVGTDDGQVGHPLIQARAQSTGRPVRQETAGPDE